MKAKVKDVCFEKFHPIIHEMGYELVEVFFGKKLDGLNMIFFIDNEKGIKIEDCENVHRKIDPILDELNPTGDDKYILSVSSLGIDRPLKTQRDFKKHVGKEIEISLYVKEDGKKNFKGVLKEFTTETITIDNEKKSTFDLKKVANITPVLKF